MENNLLNQYINILSSIALDKGLTSLSEYIKNYNDSPKKPEVDTVLTEAVGLPVYKYKITKMPEATCDGCQ